METTEQKTFYDFCRENTGKHMLDSGGKNGRAWQQPPIDPEKYPLSWDRECSATIETAALLSEALEIDRDLMTEFEDWLETADPDLNWFLCGNDFLESKGYTSQARDNVYNGENDLSQVYVWDVFTHENDDCPDWLYADNPIVIIHIHTGADVRGGYTRPIFCRPKWEYAVPVDLCAGYSVIDYRRFEGEPYELDERWQPGHSSWPYGELENDVKRFFWNTLDRDNATVCAELHNGALVKIQATMPYYGC